MYKRLRNNRYFIWFLVIGIILVASIAATIIGTKREKDLAIYTGNSSITKYTQTEEETTTKAIDIEMVKPFDIDLIVGIPVGWIETIDGRTTTYVHRESGTAIKLELLDYDPTINDITESAASAEVVSKGYTFVGFNRMSETSYELYYSDAGITTYDYIEEVIWDREHIVRYTCICDDQYYDRMKSYFTSSYQTLVWNKEAPVNDGMRLSYLSDISVEFAVPSSWYLSNSGNYGYAQIEDGSVTLSIAYIESNINIEALTTDDITYLLDPNESKKNLVLTSYQTDEEKGYVISTYISGDTKVTESTLIYPSYGALIVETISYVAGTISKDFPQICFGLVRSFREEYMMEVETTTVNDFEMAMEQASEMIREDVDDIVN